MSKIYGPNIETITIPFPEEKYNRYLDEVGVTNEKELSFTALTEMMLAIIRDFKNGSVSLDEISDMFGHLWHYVFLCFPFEQRNLYSEIDDTLLAGSELNYEIRHIIYPNGGNLVLFMTRVMQFYDRRSNK